MRFRMARPVGAAALVLTLVAAAGAACSEETAPAPGGTDSASARTTFEDVEFTDRAVVLDDDAGLRGTQGTEYRFDAGTAGLQDVVPGKVVVIPGVAVRGVTSKRVDGDEVVVETGDAALSDVIRDGTLGWSYPVSWGELPRSAYQPAGFTRVPDGPVDWAAPTAPDDPDSPVLGSTLRFKGKLQGFDTELTLTPTAERLEFEFVAKRANVRVTAKGWITNYLQETRMDFDVAAPRLVTSEIHGLKGETEVTWAAVGHGSAGLDTEVVRLSAPLEVPIPINVGPIPMIMKTKSSVRVVPVLHGQSSSGGSFKVRYDSDHGFSFSGTKPAAVSNVRTADGELGSKETVTAGYQPVGFGYGWEFPRVELAIAGIGTFAFLSLDTYAAGEFTPGTTLTADIPPCQRASVTLHAIAGLSLDALGVAGLTKQTTLWEKKIERYKDGRKCTLTGMPS